MARERITGDNLTPLIQIITWFCLILSALCFLALRATKASLVHGLKVDDYLIALSLIFCVGQSVAVTLQTIHGYGHRASTLSENQLDIILKSQYTSTLLYIPGLSYAKMAALIFIKSISPVHREKKLADFIFLLKIIICCWGVSGEIVAAFSCKFPHPWAYINGKCINGYAFVNYFEIMGTCLDASLILLPFRCLWRLNIPKVNKAYVLMFFAMRILVIAVVICKLVFLNQNLFSADPFFESWTTTLCTEIIQCLNIFSTCVLYLRPLLRSLQSGFLRVDDMRRQGFGDYFTGQSMDPGQISPVKENPPRFWDLLIALNNNSQGTQNTIDVTGGSDGTEQDVASQASQSHIIRQTTTIHIETSCPSQSRKNSQSIFGQAI